VLLTNCDELPAVLNDRQGFFCIRGADLDRLEAGDFRAMEAWLADAAFITPKNAATASDRSPERLVSRAAKARPRFRHHGLRHGQNTRRAVGRRTFCLFAERVARPRRMVIFMQWRMAKGCELGQLALRHQRQLAGFRRAG
jgi:hypothetical protein